MNPDDAGTSIRDKRQARLAASLRENLKRRKAQQRARAAEAAPAADKGRPESGAGSHSKGAADAGKR
jgi:hypothetical protein